MSALLQELAAIRAQLSAALAADYETPREPDRQDTRLRALRAAMWAATTALDRLTSERIRALGREAMTDASVGGDDV